MTNKTKKKETKEKKNGAEKPISFWGASFTQVLEALLKTKPMPKGKDTKKAPRREQNAK